MIRIFSVETMDSFSGTIRETALNIMLTSGHCLDQDVIAALADYLCNEGKLYTHDQHTIILLHCQPSNPLVGRVVLSCNWSCDSHHLARLFGEYALRIFLREICTVAASFTFLLFGAGQAVYMYSQISKSASFHLTPFMLPY